MAIQWDESLVLGFEQIDNQHQQIFEHFNKLSEAAALGKSKEVIEELTAFLFDYAHVHFTTEDKIMLEYRYPKIEEQRHEHGAFVRNANGLMKRIEVEGATREIAAEITKTLLLWIVQHIKKHDKQLVEYIKECIALSKKYENG